MTRSRRYCNLKIDVSDNYLYRINYTKNNIFKQNVDDSRSVEREFELMDIYHINQAWLTEFLTQIAALSVLNHNYYKGHKKIKEVDIHLHQVRQTTYPTIDAHNSPEGIHRDGADYIVSAFIINGCSETEWEPTSHIVFIDYTSSCDAMDDYNRRFVKKQILNIFLTHLIHM